MGNEQVWLLRRSEKPKNLDRNQNCPPIFKKISCHLPKIYYTYIITPLENSMIKCLVSPMSRNMVAIFEEKGDDIIISSNHSYTSPYIESTVSRALSELFYNRLISDGWKPIQQCEKNKARIKKVCSHQYIKDFYGI
jgi:hypothetical protein